MFSESARGTASLYVPANPADSSRTLADISQPLGGLLARMIVGSHDYVTSRYKLHKLMALEELVANHVQIVGQT